MGATINEVAKEAGVSITTVSRVLNNNYPVKKETRERIEKAIEKLNYIPNPLARGLITKRTESIGVVVPGITNLFFTTVVESIESCLRAQGYTIMLCNTNGDEKNERETLEKLSNGQIDGLILIDPTSENITNGYIEEISKKLPSIVISGYEKDRNFNYVSYDEIVGIKEAFNYLLELGHEKIGFIRGQKSLCYDMRERTYIKFIEENDLNYCNVIKVGDANTINIINEVTNIKGKLKDNMPTAVFCCNDLMSVAFINLCGKLGIRVPEDMSVVGCDNTIMATLTHPGITSVDLKMKEVGTRAAKELLQILQSKSSDIPRKIVINTSLVIRNSCIYL